MVKWFRTRWEAWMGYMYIKYMNYPKVNINHTPCHSCRHSISLEYESIATCRYHGIVGNIRRSRGLNSPDSGITCLSHSKFEPKGLIRKLWSIIW